jgi:hypothetical protein
VLGRDTRARLLSLSPIVCPPSVRLNPLAPLVPKPGAREPAAIRLPTKNRATIRVMAVNAFAEPRQRTFRKRQCGRLGAQEAFVAQPLDSWARPGPSDNADRVPRLFQGSRQLRFRHHFRKFLCHSLLLIVPLALRSMEGSGVTFKGAQAVAGLRVTVNTGGCASVWYTTQYLSVRRRRVASCSSEALVSSMNCSRIL